MNLAALVTCGGENGNKGCHLAYFNVDIGFAFYFVATYPLPPSHPIGVLVVLAMPVKCNLKLRAIQLARHSVVGK